MRFEVEVDDKAVKAYLDTLLQKEVKSQVERYVNNYDTQAKIRRVVADHLDRSLGEVVVRVAGESKQLEDQVRSTLVKRLTNKVVKEMME